MTANFSELSRGVQASTLAISELACSVGVDGTSHPNANRAEAGLLSKRRKGTARSSDRAAPLNDAEGRRLRRRGDHLRHRISVRVDDINITVRGHVARVGAEVIVRDHRLRIVLNGA